MSSQRIRYQRATDGVRFARAEAGTGPVIVKAANWLTHRVRVGKPCMAPLDAVLLGHFRFVRYDERGCGMTDWNTSDLSFDRQLADLGAVVEAAGRREPFTLLGISQAARSASGTQCGIPNG